MRKQTMKSQRQGGFLVARIHQVSGRIFARMLKDYGVEGINPAQGRIMFVLWRQDGLPISDLARRTQLGKSTLTSMLDRLEQAGWLRRESSPRDRREVIIRRTEKDKALEKLYARISEKMTEVWYDGFNGAEIDRFEADLERILGNLTRLEAELK